MEPLSLVLAVVGLVGLLVGAELLVRGASRLAGALGVSPLVIGLTVVAFGTSAPELAVSMQATWAGQGGIALGNVVGSNIANVLLILGISALVAPLIVAQKLLRLEVPLMIGSSVLVLVLCLDGSVGRLDGALLFAGLLVYLGYTLRQSQQESASVRAEYEAEYGVTAKPTPRFVGTQLLLVIAGLALLLGGSRWLVAGAVELARHFGVSDLVIGLTVVAIGTSLPEVATSVVASLKGERDIAVGNVVGSNLFNLLCVLGAAALLSPAAIPVAPAAVSFDLPVMIVVAIACLPIFFTGNRISRWEGALFVAFYGAYLLFLVLTATQHDWAATLGQVMAFFVLPLTGVTLAVIVYREVRARRAPGTRKA